jgi:VCBS repeat-containing protein
VALGLALLGPGVAGAADLRAVPGGLDGAEPARARSVQAAATGSPRGTFPSVHVAPDPGTVFGYIPLTAFGGNTITPMGDENLAKLDVPAFVYNGSTFHEITIDANGYALPGDQTAPENNNCCNIGFGTALPNGMLAPFWTDLDGTGTTGVLANVLTDGVSSWIVLEWQVNDFGTTRPRVFQIWIGINGVQDVQYAYRFDTFGERPVGGFIVGAENLDGSQSDGLGLNVMPSSDLRVTSEPLTLNELPVATDDAYETAEDTTLTVPAPGVLGNDTDAEDDPLTAALADGPEHGTVTLEQDGSFTYEPDAGYSGPDAFTYTADDPYDPSAPATVSLTVTPVNDPPSIAVTAGTSCGADDRSGTLALQLADADSAPGSLTLSAQSSNPALVPGATFAGSGLQRNVTLTAAPGRTGSATVTVTVSDGALQSSTTITVRAGGTGADTLGGTAGADVLLGQNGADTLSGLGGADVLCGGRGDDRLTGGTSADHFGGGQGADTAVDLVATDGDTAVSVP